MKVLEVSEGGRALITSEHLKVVVDYGFYGIPESGVLFHMAEAPSRGRILLIKFHLNPLIHRYFAAYLKLQLELW